MAAKMTDPRPQAYVAGALDWLDTLAQRLAIERVRCTRKEEAGLTRAINIVSELRGRAAALPTAGPERHPPGCSCGSPTCPEWQADQRG